MRVIVTRPEPAARRTADRLAADGHEAILLPLFAARHDVAVLTRALSQPFDTIAATSAEVFRAFRTLGARMPDLLSKRVFAVGEATAAAAREAGFTTVLTGPGDGAGLAERIGRETPKASVLYLAGHPRSSAFESGLTALGVPFLTTECYRMETLAHPPEQFRQTLVSASADALLLYSRETAERFFTLVKVSDADAALTSVLIVCLSAQVASAVPAVWSDRVVVADTPQEDALFRRLYEHALE